MLMRAPTIPMTAPETAPTRRGRRWRCWRCWPGRTWNGSMTAPVAGCGGSPGRVAHDRVISTVDTETRHAHKSRSRKQDGFKAHIAAEPDTGLITNVVLTKATGAGTGDAAAGAAVLAGDDSFTEPGQVLADSAYGTGD